MQSLQNFHWLATLNTMLCLAVAFCCGCIIGLERQIRQRTAGPDWASVGAAAAAAAVPTAARVMKERRCMVCVSRCSCSVHGAGGWCPAHGVARL